MRSGNFAKFMVGCFLTVCGMSHAQERYPTRPLTMVFPYPPGGFDAMARGFGDALGQVLGQSVVVVNRDGAAGRLAFENFMSASPDGHSLIFSPSAPLTSVPHMQKGVGNCWWFTEASIVRYANAISWNWKLSRRSLLVLIPKLWRSLLTQRKRQSLMSLT